MLLNELWSPIGSPNEKEQDIDWINDLKYYIDNDDEVLSKNFFPAIKRHQNYVGNPNVYKIYIRPIENSCESYCEKFQVSEREKKFPKEDLIELAKKFAEEQEIHIKNKDYDPE
jgi:hypothetical protein